MLALIVSVAPMSDAKTKKHTQSKTTTTTNWVKLTYTSNEVYYVSSDNKVLYDNNGYYYVTVKMVPVKSYLPSIRKHYNQQIHSSTMYNSYTHEIQQWKVDLNNSRISPWAVTYYANNKVISTDNYYKTGDHWFSPDYESISYDIMKYVQLIVNNNK